MSPRILQALIGVGLILGSLAAFQGLESCRGQKAEAQANVASGEAHAHQSQAQASDAKVADLQAKMAAQQTDLDKLNAEVNKAIDSAEARRRLPRPRSYPRSRRRRRAPPGSRSARSCGTATSSTPTVASTTRAPAR